MSILSNIGKDAGEGAAEQIHQAVDDALPVAQRIATEAGGSVERSFGSLETILSSLPEAILSALSGLKIQTSGVSVKIAIEIVNPQVEVIRRQDPQ